MPDGRRRTDVARDDLLSLYTTMILRSTRSGKIMPRYRVATIGYADNVIDFNNGIVDLEKIAAGGIPSITHQFSTNMALAFRYTSQLITNDIKTWSSEWLERCPTPMVINITDCELAEDEEDPAHYAKELMEISVPDGHVLLENIYINDRIEFPKADFREWNGFKFTDTTGCSYGDKILSMSSPTPPRYALFIQEQTGVDITDGSAMIFPGINREFINAGFVMSEIAKAPHIPHSKGS